MMSRTESNTELTPLQRAVVAMKEMRRKITSLEEARTEPVAVIGIGCRFPGDADSPEAYWRLLLDGVDAVSEVPEERWDVDAYYDPDPDRYGTMTTRHGGFLANVGAFDPHFFGMSEHEATSIDPQHRLLLEVAWEALERACIAPAALNESRTGVFIGITAMEYIYLLMRAQMVNAYYVGGAPLCAAAGRLSHLLGLQGPSMSIDTACSSALVSLHQACHSLRSGECDLALAGGVNLTLTPQGTVFLSRARMLAPDGRCKTFAAAADGFVRGEGCGLLVLRRLADAEAAGDPIRSVILGSAVNHDGPSNGFTAPNGRSQEKLIRQALDNANADALEVDFVETHGTGTPLGDPIEVGAIATALCRERAPEAPLYLGAVKTNLGHLESAAGSAGFIKAMLALENGKIPGNLHLGEPNPHIPWDRLPIKVPSESVQWPGNGKRKVAGVSAFGATGTNAHVVVAEAPPQPTDAVGKPDRGLYLLALSARCPRALVDLAGLYSEYLCEHPEQVFADVCFSAASGRNHFEHRLAVVSGSGPEAADQLEAFVRGEQRAGIFNRVVEGPHAPGVGLVFTGEQLPPDTLDALLEVPAFAHSYKRSQLELKDAPACESMSVDYALYQLWRSWGLQAIRVAGLGDGIRTAGIVAGVTSFAAAVRLARGLDLDSEHELQPPTVPLLSASDGTVVPQSKTEDPDFWRDIEFNHEPDRLADGFRREGVTLVVSTGVVNSSTGGEPEWVASFGERDVWANLLGGLARMFVRGVKLDMAAIDQGRGRRKLVLPTYPFQRIRCWPDFEPFTTPDVPAAEEGRDGAEKPCPRSDTAPTKPSSGAEPNSASVEDIFVRQLDMASDTLARVIDQQLAVLAGEQPIVAESFVNEKGLEVDKDHVFRPATEELRRLSIGAWNLLMLAAPCEEELERQAQYLADMVSARPDSVFEIGEGRPDDPTGVQRRVIVFRDPAEVASILAEPHGAPRRTADATWDGRRPSVSFMLPGLGDHYVGMAEGLYRAADGFRRRLDRCAALLEPELEVDLLEVLFADGSDTAAQAGAAPDLRRMLERSDAPIDDAGRRLNRIVYAHPAIFSVEYALAGLWHDWGVSPQALLGFSLGELVAATLADVMSLESGLTLVARRARLIEKLAPGAMLAVPLSLDDLHPLLDGEVSVAVMCAPEVQVVSGPSENIGLLEDRLGKSDVVCKRLQSEYAFHCTAMSDQEYPVRHLVSGYQLRPAAIPICSNTSGRWLAPDEATDPGYWARHTALPVRFGDGVQRLLETDHQMVIEVGPGQSLTSFALQSPSREAVSAVEFLPTVRSRHENDDDEAVMLLSLGRLWLRGVEVSPPVSEGGKSKEGSWR